MDLLFKPKGPEGGALLRIQGRVTVTEAALLRNGLLEAFEKCDSLRIDLEGLEEGDLSLLQILCAAHREALAAGKRVVLEGITREDLARLLEKAGYLHQAGCLSGAKDSCLWSGVNSSEGDGCHE